MIKKPYTPDIGDVVWLEFDPQSGHEQAGHRPAVVLTPSSYNSKTSFIVCCPLTTQIKGYPFEVVTEVSGVRSVILSDQVKSLNWRTRKAKFKGKVPIDDLNNAKFKIKALLSIQ